MSESGWRNLNGGKYRIDKDGKIFVWRAEKAVPARGLCDLNGKRLYVGRGSISAVGNAETMTDAVKMVRGTLK